MTRTSRGLHVAVVTIVHDPQDARIRHREIAALLDAGARVTFAAPFTAYGREIPGRDDPQRARLRGIDLPRASGRSRGAALRAAVRLLRRVPADVDVVLLHDPELLAAAAAAGLGRLSGGPSGRHGIAGGRRLGLDGTAVVWDVHEDTAAALAMKTWLPGPARKLLPRLVLAAESLAERHLHLLLAEDAYVHRFRLPHPVVPNSVLVPPAPPSPPGPTRVVYIGRLTRPRGALDMVEAARLLRAEVGDAVRVELVGNADGDVREQVAAAADAGDLLWHGFLPNTVALGLLDGALAGLSLLHDEPNYAHSRPTKVMEYMAYGVPVITTPNAASTDLVDRFASGVTVPFQDPKAVAAAVLDLQADEGRRLALARAGRAAAMEHFDWAVDGRRFVATLHEWAAGMGAAGMGAGAPND